MESGYSVFNEVKGGLYTNGGTTGCQQQIQTVFRLWRGLVEDSPVSLPLSTVSHCVAETGLELALVLLLQPPDAGLTGRTYPSRLFAQPLSQGS